jgi:hypothetical protein
MPFDEEEDKPSVQSQKIGLKKVSSQKSIFEAMPKKPSPEEFEQRVQQVQERSSSYKVRVSELALQFNKAMADKTLSQNRNMFQQEVELDLLRSMVKLAQEVNNDPDEKEGEGSLSWITVLLKTCFNQRDRINRLEYSLSQIEKKIEPLDKPKKSE